MHVFYLTNQFSNNFCKIFEPYQNSNEKKKVKKEEKEGNKDGKGMGCKRRKERNGGGKKLEKNQPSLCLNH